MQVPFMIVTIIALLILGSPVYLALLSGCVVYFVGSPTLSMFMLPQKMINAMDSFTFLAIPFFLIAGQIMNRGGITKRIFHFSDTLVGRFSGGLGYVNILSSFITFGLYPEIASITLAPSSGVTGKRLKSPVQRFA